MKITIPPTIEEAIKRLNEIDKEISDLERNRAAIIAASVKNDKKGTQ